MYWRVNRFSRLHNSLRFLMNNVLFLLPNYLKYRVGKSLRSKRLPYKLIGHGWVIVQVGCPWDLLHAGRSRGIYFSLFTGKRGKVIIIEPDTENLKRLQTFIVRKKLKNIIIVNKGAWSSKKKINFLSNHSHPATNLLEEVYDKNRKDLDRFRRIEVEVDTIDNLLSSLGITKVDLISVTTNGAEEEILKGMHNTLKRTRYISMIDIKKLFPIMVKSGYCKLGDDDRGLTFAKV